MKPPLVGPAFGVNLLVEVAGEDDVLERGELGVPQVHLALEAVEHVGEIGDLGADAVVGFRAAGRRLAVEIELALVDVRHVREALAQRIEPDHVGVHLAEAHGHGVHAFLQLRAQVCDLAALFGEDLRTIAAESPWPSAAPLRWPSFMPRAKAVPRMPSASTPTTPSVTGWARFNCRARPSRCENKIRFMLPAPEARVTPKKSPGAWTMKEDRALTALFSFQIPCALLATPLS